MIVITRKRDEGIVISDSIEIIVIEIRGDKVRLGVHAPSHVPVHRKEVYEAIRRIAPDSAPSENSPPNP
jgi:carbon storage regulator